MYCCSISEIWKLESLGIHDESESRSSKQVYDDVMNHFKKNIRLNEENRYEVKLPWMHGHPELISNKGSAVQRLGAMSKKLISKEIFAEYDSVLKQWLSEGIIEVVQNDEEKKGYFLPHRPVIKENSLTTKIRPVFDGSAEDINRVSLNSCLEKGLNLIELIPSILYNFRFYKIGVIADIRKAFLQISVDPSDRDFLKFVWWKDTVGGEVVTYRHCRLVFGLKPSPFLLGATIGHHLETVKGDFDELLIEILKNSFYVDNLVTSVSSQKELELFFAGSNGIMEKGRFRLGSWAHTIIKNRVSEFKLNDEFNEVQSVLGMIWDVRSDLLYCDVKDVTLPESTVRTKRVILSIAQKIFDPIGITSPTTLLPKILLQEAWSLNLGWDEELPKEIRKEFDSWLEKLHFLKFCKIPRYVFQSPPVSYTIHAFSDASKKAYAGCVFIRAITSEGIKVQLLQAKSRVSPLKPISIPRLELLAAVIAGRLVQTILKNPKFSGVRVFYWTDSKVVLGWLACNKGWNTFVSNRVREILEHSCLEQWRYVPGEINIADLPSRGCNALNLLKSKWWEGPSWLINDEKLWPKESVNLSNQEVETLNLEKRKSCSVLHGTIESLNIFAYFSKCYKITRMVGWMLRFCNNCKGTGKKLMGPLSLDEISNAELVILKLVQKESFESDKDREFKKFEVFKDEKGLLRLKTKLFYGEYDNLFKCPVLLPPNHIFIKRLIEQAHLNLKHAGVATLVTFLRERYWIIRARKTVKQVVNSCVKCKRFTAKRAETPFIPLPKERVNMVQAFAVTGVDTAGPLFLKSDEKVWIIIFTCAVYRCVHFELITSLSTECFLLSLRRFIARRGRIAVIFSDNGSNFIGAYNLFKNLNWEEVREYAYVNKIEWHFNPPTAAWWGGFWERMIRTLKDLLKRNLGRALVNYEELLSILVDCEAVINSRPITYFNDDPGELRPLTPAMFLHPIGECEVADLDSLDSNALNKRIKHINHVRQNLRNRFRKEYLSQLATRPPKNVKSIEIGDVVLIGCEDKKRVHWPIGRVLEVFPGRDGACRVAKVQTTQGTLIRPFQRLYSLEVSDIDKTSIAENYKKSKEIVENQNSQRRSDEKHEVLKISRFGRTIRSPSKYDV